MEKLSEKDEKFAYNYLQDREAYHHHKEQMAYIGFLVQTAFFTAIMTFDWGGLSSLNLKYVLALGVIFWGLIHVFLRWQLQRRRFAALQVAAILNALLKSLKGTARETPRNENPTGQGEGTSESGLRIWKRWFNWVKRGWKGWVDLILFPYPSAYPSSDIKLNEYPEWYQVEFWSQATKSTGAVLGEWVVTLGSWFILASIIGRLTVLS